ncbi:Rqc2 family fibronectin-binding protein [Caldalkalibacillus mannanilyticus]|uniref:Rqc2 family fibronectin-binding protein n=1 Tax=Caldalkalibacillus mannanilyticus TaxID=1418 RepID=UPI000469902E|nr:NFACT RNA binding domain-containing protein [Caldalkalibacillus mannanilyticus]
MAFDGMMTYAITAELASELAGGKITKIYQPYERELIFHIRSNGKNHKLLLSVNPTYPRIHLTQMSYENPAEAPMFCMLLRKHLEGGIIEKIEQQQMDRMIYFDVRSRNELGDMTFRRLMIEIMGRHSNIILLDPEKQSILDSIHHVSHDINQHRVVLPGRQYVLPPEQHKLHPFEATADTILKQLDFNQGKLDQQIVQSFSGISPLLAKEIIYKAGIGEKERIAQSFLSIVTQIKERQLEPCIIEAKDKSYFYLLPLEHLQGKHQTFLTLSSMLEAFFHGKAERDRVKQKSQDFIRFLTSERDKNKKKVTKLEKSLKDTEKADQLRLYGELLTAYLHEVKRGDKQIEVINYYDENGGTLLIELDPSLSPNENAQSYYKKYSKAKKSVEFIQEQLKLAHAEISYFESLIQQLEQASPKDVEEMREELIEGGYLRDRSKQKKKKKKEEKPSLESYVSSDGTEIIVGKNNKQNEYLTNRLARSTDTWLHTKDIPGSHVVIRGEQFSEQTLLEAAELAAYYSKARTSSQVPVDYTLIKHVKKPSGAKPGYVIYDQQKTVFVTPTEEGIAKLKKDDQGKK